MPTPLCAMVLSRRSTGVFWMTTPTKLLRSRPAEETPIRFPCKTALADSSSQTPLVTLPLIRLFSMRSPVMFGRRP